MTRCSANPAAVYNTRVINLSIDDDISLSIVCSFTYDSRPPTTSAMPSPSRQHYECLPAFRPTKIFRKSAESIAHYVTSASPPVGHVSGTPVSLPRAEDRDVSSSRARPHRHRRRRSQQAARRATNPTALPAARSHADADRPADGIEPLLHITARWSATAGAA